MLIAFSAGGIILVGALGFVFRGEIQRAMADYQRTRFGGWPWPNDAPVHPRDAGRFAKHADGRLESFPR